MLRRELPCKVRSVRGLVRVIFAAAENDTDQAAHGLYLAGQNAAQHTAAVTTTRSIGFGAMDVTKPYKFIGFGAMDVTKPYKFIGLGARHDHKMRI